MGARKQLQFQTPAAYQNDDTTTRTDACEHEQVGHAVNVFRTFFPHERELFGICTFEQRDDSCTYIQLNKTKINQSLYVLSYRVQYMRVKDELTKKVIFTIDFYK